jgi:hypothetical protein
MMRRMRTTIDLPPDLHRVVSSIAAHTGRSMNRTVAELIRRGLALAADGGQTAGRPAIRIDARTGLPSIHSSRPITPEDVRALEDE